MEAILATSGDPELLDIDDFFGPDGDQMTKSEFLNAQLPLDPI